MLRWFLLACFLSIVTSAQAETVLVLPFRNASGAQQVEWVGESIADTIREALASGGVLVLDRVDREEGFRRLSMRPGAHLTTASILKLAQALDASRVVYGRFEVEEGPPDRVAKWPVRIRSHILNLATFERAPDLVETGALEDLASLEIHLSWQALRFFAPGTTPSEDDYRKQRPALRLDALESYTRGLLAATREQKQRLFAQAARLDERFSQPCYELGRMYVDNEEYRNALAWLQRVLPEDSHYHEAQFMLGLSRYFTTDFAGAEAAFRIVAESVPLNEVFNDLGAAQSRRNQPQALEQFRKALEGDASDPDYHFNLGYALWKQGRFQEAADSFRAVLERTPDDTEATKLLGRCLQKSGPKPGDPQSDGLERIKFEYEETAFRQLKAALEK